MPRKKKTLEQELPDSDWVPIDATRWLTKMSRHQKFGTNYFQLCLDVLRYLLREREMIKVELDRREAEIARLQKLKTPVPFDVGGDGQIGS